MEIIKRILIINIMRVELPSHRSNTILAINRTIEPMSSPRSCFSLISISGDDYVVYKLLCSRAEGNLINLVIICHLCKSFRAD